MVTYTEDIRDSYDVARFTQVFTCYICDAPVTGNSEVCIACDNDVEQTLAELREEDES